MNTGTRMNNNGVYNDLRSYEDYSLKIPWKGIAMAFCLSLTGFWLLGFGIFTALGYLDEKYEDRIFTCLILGGLTFIPGTYHMYIAYCAYTRKYGYSYDDIPDLD